LKGHDRGVNWGCYQPTILASAADDRHVKLWRMSETKAWEVDKLIHFYERQQCIFLSFSSKA